MMTKNADKKREQMINCCTVSQCVLFKRVDENSKI